MEQTFRKSVQVLAGISAALLLGILLLYTSASNPAVFGKYSIEYLLLVVAVIGFYLSSILFLLRIKLLRRQGFQNALLFALSLIIMILLAEIGFRAMDGFGFVRGSEIEQHLRQVRHDQPYIFCGTNTHVREFCVRRQNNSLGFNDKEYALEKPPGVYRIVVLGDSYVEAKQVALEDTFHKLIEAQLNTRGLRVEVIALGKSAVGTVKHLEILKNIGLKYDPDLIILEFLAANDVRDNSPVLNKFESDPEWQEAWDITFDAILQIQRIAKENGIDFLVVSFTSKVEIASYQSQSKLREALRTSHRAEALADEYDFKLPDKLMADFTSQHQIPYLQLNPVFATMKEQAGSDIQFHFFMTATGTNEAIKPPQKLFWIILT